MHFAAQLPWNVNDTAMMQALDLDLRPLRYISTIRHSFVLFDNLATILYPWCLLQVPDRRPLYGPTSQRAWCSRKEGIMCFCDQSTPICFVKFGCKHTSGIISDVWFHPFQIGCRSMMPTELSSFSSLFKRFHCTKFVHGTNFAWLWYHILIMQVGTGVGTRQSSVKSYSASR